MSREIVVKISNSYIQTLMTRLKFHSPPLSQTLDILWTYLHNFFSFSFNRDSKAKNLTLHFTLQSLFQVSFQVQLSFQVKFVVSRVICQNYVPILFATKEKEEKRNFVCVIWINLLYHRLYVYLIK